MVWIIIIGSIGAIFIIAYLKKYLVKKYYMHQYNSGVGIQYRDFTKEYYQFNDHKSIDEETFVDLEMPQILKKINYTYSEIGNEYLYNCFFKDNNDFVIQEEIIKNLSDQKKLVEAIYQLNKLNKTYVPILSIKQNLKSIPNKYLLIVVGCLLINIASLIATIISLKNIFYLIVFGLFSLLINAKLTQKVGKLTLQVSFINDLVFITNKLLKTNIYPEPNKTIVNKACNNLKKITKVTYYLNMLKQIDIFQIFELFKGLFFVDIIQAVILAKKANHVQQSVLILYENIGLLDTCITIKVIRSLFNTCIPKVLEEEKIEVVKGYHVLINKPVENSLVLDNNAIITGSNASGKSTFLKMVGANLLLAKGLNISFAKEFNYYPFGLISSIHMKDDIINGDSFYVKEIKRLNKITKQAAHQKLLILIDEILKGTNEKERILIAQSLLKYLFNCNSLTVVSTHDIELTAKFNSINKYCFNDHKKDNNIIFNYLIEKGICTIGNAIAIVNSLDFDQEILNNLNNSIEA